MKRLTPKEQKLVELKVRGVKHSKAYKEAYDSKASDKTARIETTRTRAKPHVKQAYELALEKHRITIDRAVNPVSKALDDDDIKVQLMGSDRALKLLGITDKEQGSFHLHLHAQRDRYKGI